MKIKICLKLLLLTLAFSGLFSGCGNDSEKTETSSRSLTGVHEKRNTVFDEYSSGTTSFNCWLNDKSVNITDGNSISEIYKLFSSLDISQIKVEEKETKYGGLIVDIFYSNGNTTLVLFADEFNLDGTQYKINDDIDIAEEFKALAGVEN